MSISKDVQGLTIVVVGVLLFFFLLFGSITYSEIQANETRRVCLEQGNPPRDC